MGRRKKCEQIKRTNNVMVRFIDAEYASISIRLLIILYDHLKMMFRQILI